MKIFHVVRRDLIGPDKLYKFMSHAIGESILMVIGILFALQINNWNEERKLCRIGSRYPSDLIKDLSIRYPGRLFIYEL